MLKKYAIIFNKKKLDKFLKRIKNYDQEKKMYVLNQEIDKLKEMVKVLEQYKMMEE